VQKEEKQRPDTRKSVSDENPRPGARETGARSASGLRAHQLLNMLGLEPLLRSQPGAMPSAPGVQAPNGGEGAPDPGRQLATCAFVLVHECIVRYIHSTHPMVLLQRETKLHT
jgi:hypothetical protein